MKKEKAVEREEDSQLEELDYVGGDYVLNGQRGFPLDISMRMWKTKYETLDDFKRAIIKHPVMGVMYNFVSEMWDDIIPISVDEALKETNMETRRVYFDYIGVTKLFKELNPKLLDKKVLGKERHRWNSKDEEYVTKYDDVYELYEIDGKRLFIDENRRNNSQNIYAVRCWCPSTEREYWIYVPAQAALGGENWKLGDNPDAIRAIAWTITLNITNPKRIFRQGDIIIAERSETSQDVVAYHISPEQYVELMYSET